jgi:hypothetical protein
VPNVPPADGQLLGWSAASSAWLPVTVAPPPNFAAAFSGTTVLAIPGTQHNLNTPNLVVSCYDSASPANMIEPSNITVNQSTYDVAISFLQPQSGRCVVNGSGGESGVVGGGINSPSSPGYLTGSASLAFGVIPSGSCSAGQSISVPGAVAGRSIAPGWPALPPGFLGMMQVSSTGTVSVSVCNLSGAAAGLPALTYLATVFMAG